MTKQLTNSIKGYCRSPYVGPGGYELMLAINGDYLCPACVKVGLKDTLMQAKEKPESIFMGVIWEGDNIPCSTCDYVYHTAYGRVGS